MDNLTHSLAGWALGQAGLKTKTRKGLAALILGANMPDIDVFFGAFPWDPLAIHRGFTHGLIGGVLLMPPVLAGLLWLLDRWQVGRGKIFKSGLAMHFSWLVALAYLGAATHPLLDLQTTYAVQLFSPVSMRWYHSDSLFIIDVWLWALLGLSIAWSRMREKRGQPLRRPPQIAIAVTLGYIAFNLAISTSATSHVRQWASGRSVDALFASPPPVLFWRRALVWREGECYRRSTFDPLGAGFAPVGACEPTNLGDPLVRVAFRRDPELRKFLRWSVLPQASLERRRCAVQVTVGDARYGPSGQSRLGHDTVVPVAGPGCLLDTARAQP